MAESYEKLGLEIVLNTSETFKRLEDLLTKLSKVQETISKVGSGGDGLKLTKGQFELLGKVIEKNTDQAKDLYKVLSDSTAVARAAKGIREIGGASAEMAAKTKLAKAEKDELIKKFKEEGSAIVSAKKNTDAYYSALGGQIQAITRNTEAAAKAERKASEDKAAAINSAIKNTEAAAKAERKASEDKASAINSAIKNTEAAAKAERKASEDKASAINSAIKNTEKLEEVKRRMEKGFATTGANVKGIDDSVNILEKKYPKADLTNIRSQIAEINRLISAGGGKAELDQVRVKYTELTNTLRNLKSTVRDTNKETTLLGITFKNMATRLAEFYSIREVMFAVAGQIREAVAGALDLNQAVHDIAAVSGAGSNQYQMISDSIMDIAKSSRYTVQEVNKLMQILAQAGVAAEILPEVSKQVGMFATATNSAPDIAADVVTTAMNVFEIKADEVARITNTMTAALNESKLETQGLATAFNYLAPQASQLGYSLEETLGIIAQMAQAGIKPSTIGTGVSQMLKEFAAPKKRLRTMLEHYGISPEEINPRLNTFSEIVGKLQEKGVAVEHLFQALETRVGRSVVTAVTLGANSFLTMTEAVTGTQAATVAYEKAMEGARARINVLKQEFLGLVVSLGTALAPVLSEVLKLLTNFVRGLNTVEGKIIGLIAVIGGAAFAVSALSTAAKVATPALAAMGISMAATPWGAILAVVGLTVGVIAALGSTTDTTTEKYRKFSEEQGKVSQAHSAAIRTLGEVRKGYLSDIKELDEVTKKYGDTSSQASAIKNKEIKLTKESSNALVQLKLQYPDYFSKLNTEIKTVGDLVRIYKDLNNQRVLGEKANVSAYNDLTHKIQAEEEVVKEYRTKIAKEGKKGGANPLDAYFAGKSQKKIDSWKEQRDKLTINKDNTVVDRNGDLQYREGAADKTGKAVDDIYGRGNTAAQAAAARRTQASIDADLMSLKAGTQKLLAEKAKLEKDKADIELERTGDVAAYKLAAATAIEDEYQAKLAEHKLNREKDQLEFAAKKGVKEEERVLYDKNMALKKEVDEATLLQARDNALAKVNQTFSEVKSSDDAEKQADRRLRLAQSRISLEKELADNAAQIRDLEYEQLKITLETSESKRKAYDLEIKGLEKQQKEAEANKSIAEWNKLNLHRLEDIRAKHEEILLLIQQQERELAKNEDRSQWGLMKKGAKSAFNQFKIEADNPEQLGSNVATMGINGITDALSGMITALGNGENAWRSFRQGLGNILKEISGELMKYVTKLLVVFAVQKLVGLFAGNVAGINSQGVTETGAFSMSNASSGSYAQTFFPNAVGFADGGEVSALDFTPGGWVPTSIGKRGKDSVPAWLMPGEYVLKEDAVNHYGVDYFREHNAKRFAEGGIVGSASAAKDKKAGTSGDATLQIVNVVDPKTIPRVTDEQIINVISLDAVKNGPAIRTIKAKLQG